VKIVSVMTTASAGGAEFAAVELLDALAQRGHEVVLLSDLPGIGRSTAVPVHPIELGPKLSTTSWRWLIRRWVIYVHRLRKELERHLPYDVLLVHYKKEQLMTAWLPSHLRQTLAWAEWGPVPYQLRKGIPRAAYLRAASRAAVVMAVSAGTKRSVEDVGIPGEKVFVVPNAVDVDSIRFSEAGRAAVRARLRIPPDAFVVGCVSRFHYKKRNDVVIDAVLGLDDPSVHLVMAGAGGTESELRAQAEPLVDRAHFITTPGDDIADVMSAFDVSVFCPSPTEGAPRATILGMLAERPTLATGPEGVADLIRPEFGAISEPENDPRALTGLLSRYRDDPGLRAGQGRAARAWAEQEYAPAAVAGLVEGLLGPGRPGSA
jgi:glycosyltransferase involved in cell wall biosynthesis